MLLSCGPIVSELSITILIILQFCGHEPPDSSNKFSTGFGPEQYALACHALWDIPQLYTSLGHQVDPYITSDLHPLPPPPPTYTLPCSLGIIRSSNSTLYPALTQY